MLCAVSFLEHVNALAVTPCNSDNRGFSRASSVVPLDEWFPEVGAANGETNEACNASGRRQPFTHFVLVLAAAENDAAHFVSSAMTSGCYDSFAVLAAVETFDFPNVGFYVCVLKLFDSMDHKKRPNL